MQDKLLNTLDRYLASLTDTDVQVAFQNKVKVLMHRHSPFQDEPVDCVIWVHADTVLANDYNPNSMAPAEKRLLKHSLEKDGFTQPLVAMPAGREHLLIDGYHRHLLGKKQLRERLKGYLPVARIRHAEEDVTGRIAMTIRHNRARGKHAIAAMSDIVRDLTRLGWNDKRICAELGMDSDEVLRLKQLSGLAELFLDQKPSEAWTIK